MQGRKDQVNLQTQSSYHFCLCVVERRPVCNNLRIRSGSSGVPRMTTVEEQILLPISRFSIYLSVSSMVRVRVSYWVRVSNPRVRVIRVRVRVSNPRVRVRVIT